MGLFDKAYKKAMDYIRPDASKDEGEYDKNEKSDSNNDFKALVKENEGKVVISRTFVIEFFGKGPKYSSVVDNYIDDDIRKIVKITSPIFGGSYKVVLERLNPQGKFTNVEKTITLKFNSVDELKKLFEDFKTANIVPENNGKYVIIKMSSSKSGVGLAGMQNPHDFVFADAQGLADYTGIDAVITKMIAEKLGKPIEEVDDYETPKEWNLRDHNLTLSNYAMDQPKYKTAKQKSSSYSMSAAAHKRSRNLAKRIITTRRF